MNNCEQMKGMSVYEHGVSVHDYFLDLKNHILYGKKLKYEWKLPEWILDKSLWFLIESEETISNYQIYHDCGKPFCIEIDQEGKKHFPNHANISADIWFNLTNNELESDLMRHDMDIHLLKNEDIDKFCDLSFAPTLLITGFCELHSNASMFGGLDSVSFKIKWKKLNKQGNKISEILKKNKGENYGN